MSPLELNGLTLTIKEVIEVAENFRTVKINAEISNNIKKKRRELDKQLSKYPQIKMYGTNVGCGDLKDTEIAKDSFNDYQIRYLRAHNCGTGKPLDINIVRAIMLIRLNSFVKNLSGMRWETCKTLLDMLNKRVTPWILEEGSVGASGDLVPLAMMGAVMVGMKEAQAYVNGKLLSASKALQTAGIKPTQLGAKEAMGLTNGSNFITAFCVFAIRDSELLIKNASIAAALSLEAIRGDKDAFNSFLNNNRPHEGQKIISRHIDNLLNNSQRTKAESQLKKINNQNEKTVRVRVQDRYSFRAVPPVHGACLEAIMKLRSASYIELNSATDNPLFRKVKLKEIEPNLSPKDYKKIKDEGIKEVIKAYSGANFHGQPLANIVDYVKLSLTSLGLISDKRTFSLLNEDLNFGLPRDLAYDTNKGDTGLMIAQYAGAGRAAENRVLSTPSSVMSISTAANQEDFVSMGSIGVIHLRKIIYNVQIILAIEILCALRALQMTIDSSDSSDKKLGKLGTLAPQTFKIYDYLTKQLPLVKEDEYLRTPIVEITQMVKDGKLVQLVESSLKIKS